MSAEELLGVCGENTEVFCVDYEQNRKVVGFLKMFWKGRVSKILVLSLSISLLVFRVICRFT